MCNERKKKPFSLLLVIVVVIVVMILRGGGGDDNDYLQWEFLACGLYLETFSFPAFVILDNSILAYERISNKHLCYSHTNKLSKINDNFPSRNKASRARLL